MHAEGFFLCKKFLVPRLTRYTFREYIKSNIILNFDVFCALGNRADLINPKVEGHKNEKVTHSGWRQRNYVRLQLSNTFKPNLTPD